MVSFRGAIGFAVAICTTFCQAEQNGDMNQRHVVFENSRSLAGYYFSSASVVGPSELEVLNEKCPVDSKHFVSPPNSLRLNWKSSVGGDWRVVIKVASRYGRRFEFEGDTLSLWCYSKEGLSSEISPRIWVSDSQGKGLPSIPLLSAGNNLPANQWVEIRLPFALFYGPFEGTRDVEFEPKMLSEITLVQGLDDNTSHQLYLDDIRIIPGSKEPQESLATPQLVETQGFDRHIEIAWQPNRSGKVCNYRIYRSEDGGEIFKPHATRPSFSHRFCDFVSEATREYSYKVSAVDLDNRESPLSAVGSARANSLNDEQLLSMVQEACFRYYWDGANVNSGMALEIWPGDQDLVALGASGFGVMALIAAAEREFVEREEAADRMRRIVRFLQKADRFHGVWPHFLVGSTGKAWPYFGKYDDGGDLVETAFMMQGLLAARQYFDRDDPVESEIRQVITQLWKEVEWDWYRKEPNSPVLYWHWSPEHEWHIGHPLIGWNETMIVYLLAIASPTHSIPADLYYSGWAGTSQQAVEYRQGWSRSTQGDHYANGNEYFGHKLDVGCGTGGDLFFAQFSYLGFDPRNRKDRFTNYFDNNRSLALINRAYCMANPKGFVGYGPNCWGLSAGVNNGGGKPDPRNDNGTICCSASLGCFPYVPREAMATLKHFYRQLGDKVWGEYGFHDGFNQTQDWYEEVYMGLNQAQIVVGIENYRTGLLWRHFMSNPEIEPALQAIGLVPNQQ